MSESELLAQFSSCWPVIGKMWQKYKDTSSKSTRMLGFCVTLLRNTALSIQKVLKILYLLATVGVKNDEHLFKTAHKIFTIYSLLLTFNLLLSTTNNACFTIIF